MLLGLSYTTTNKAYKQRLRICIEGSSFYCIKGMLLWKLIPRFRGDFGDVCPFLPLEIVSSL